MNFQPVIPLAQGKWITRTIFPFAWIPDRRRNPGQPEMERWKAFGKAMVSMTPSLFFLAFNYGTIEKYFSEGLESTR